MEIDFNESEKTQTALCKSMNDIKNYVKSLNTDDNLIYKNNELLILSCFVKSMEILESNLDLEKNQIIESFCSGYVDTISGIDYFNKKYKQ